jgi:hypothetical protein
MNKSKYLSPRLGTLISLDFKLYFRKKGNFILFFAMPLLCGLLLSVSTSGATFSDYENSLPIIFAASCTAILLGLVLSINMVCKDFPILHRMLRKGLPPTFIVLSKTMLILFLCFVMAAIMTTAYFSLLAVFGVTGMDISQCLTFFLYTYITMVAAAEMGLFVSSLPKISSDQASTMVSFIISFQILFSNHLPGISNQANESLSIISFSRHSITLLGGAMGVASDRYASSIEAGIVNLGALVGFFILFLLFSCAFLKLTDLD